MKQLIAKLLLIVVLGLSAFSPFVAAGHTAIFGTHAAQHTHQIAKYRPCSNPSWPGCSNPA